MLAGLTRLEIQNGNSHNSKYLHPFLIIYIFMADIFSSFLLKAYIKGSFYLNSMGFFFEVAINTELTNGTYLANTVVESFVRVD